MSAFNGNSNLKYFANKAFKALETGFNLNC